MAEAVLLMRSTTRLAPVIRACPTDMHPSRAAASEAPLYGRRGFSSNSLPAMTRNDSFANVSGHRLRATTRWSTAGAHPSRQETRSGSASLQFLTTRPGDPDRSSDRTIG